MRLASYGLKHTDDYHEFNRQLEAAMDRDEREAIIERWFPNGPDSGPGQRPAEDSHNA
jgi:hypothetical protein